MTKMSENKHLRILSFFLLLLILTVHIYPESTWAAEMTDIRVGLEALYKNKSSVMIYNSNIALGFCVGNRYSAELELESATGFSFTPDKGTYYEDQNNYPTFAKAMSICGMYEHGGATAFPEYAGTGCWKCCVTASSYNTLAGSDMKDMVRDLKKKEPNAYLVRISGQNTTLLIDGEQAGAYPQIKALNPTNNIYSLNLGTRSYRGRIEIGRYNGSSTLTAVNIINIESYLLGVVTSEMNHTWHKEALKAQAVCSRSFAYQRAGFGADSNLKNPYNIEDTTASQVYKGVGAETPESLEAVTSTTKQIVMSGGKPIDAFFFSTSGGATDEIMDIWGVKSGVYRGVFDIYEKNPEKKPWMYDFTAEEVSKKLADAGYDVGKVRSIEPTILTQSGRVYRCRIKGDKKTVTLSGTKIRSIFDFSDTKFRVITGGRDDDIVYAVGEDTNSSLKLKDSYVITSSGTVRLSDNKEQYILITDGNLYNVPSSLPDPGVFRFIGMGWGHGVGMSQSGAEGMASEGYDYGQIIAFYFNEAEIGTY